MDNPSKLTYLQTIALKGDVALLVSTSFSDADIKYKFYMILKDISQNARPYVIKAFKEAVTFNEEEIDRIVLELTNNQVPIWLWIEKAISDIKGALVIPEASFSLKLSIDRKEQKKNVVMSAFAMFVRTAAFNCINSAMTLCRRVLEDSDLEFLHALCFELLSDFEEIEKTRPIKSLPNPSVMDIEFDLRDLMNFQIEKDHVNELVEVFKNPDTEKVEKVENNQSYFKVVESMTEAMLPIIKPMLMEKISSKNESSKIVFLVKKTYNGSHISTVLKTCETESEAINFVREVESDFPEIKNTCTLEIVKERVKE